MSITVNAVNDPPEAGNESVTTDEDTGVTIDVLANDSDVDGDTLTISIDSQPTDGIVVNNGTNVTYTPHADFCNETTPDRFTYTVNDGNGGTDTATVDVTVTCMNDDPQAVDDTVSVPQGESVTINVLANDKDADGSGLTVTAIASFPGNGMAEINGNNTITYTPDMDFNGEDEFTYMVGDGEGDTDTATVYVSVTSEPEGLLEYGSLDVGGAYVNINLANAYVSPVVVCSVQYNNNSTPVVVRVSNVTSSSFDVRLQNPLSGPVATEKVTYLVAEEGVWSIDDVNIEAHTYVSTVTDENDSWVGEAQSYEQSYTNPVVVGQVMSENDADWSVFWCQGGSRTDPPSATVLRTGKMVGEDTDTTRADEIIGFIVFEAGHGTINGVEFEALLGPDIVEGVDDSPPYVYSFDAAFSSVPEEVVTTLAGMDGMNGGWAQTHGPTPATTTELYLSVDEDQNGDSERSHITEQVSYIAFGPAVGNIPPVADDQSLTTEVDVSVVITLTATDVNGDSLTYSIITLPTNGNLSGSAPDLTYTPNTGYSGSDSFTYIANDGTADSNEATVTITVSPENQAPIVLVAGPTQTVTLPNSAPLDGTVTDDGLPPGSTLTTTWTKQSGSGTVTFGNPNAVDTTASFSVDGTYLLRLTAYDGEESAFDEVTITVNPDTQPPSPDPTWASPPSATGTSSISMTATTVYDPSGVEYYFEEVSGNPGGSDSGWQESTSFTDTGLNADTTYTYRVRARDKSANQNVTSWSSPAAATTDAEAPKRICGAEPMYGDSEQTTLSASDSVGNALLPLLPSMMALGLWRVRRTGRSQKKR